MTARAATAEAVRRWGVRSWAEVNDEGRYVVRRGACQVGQTWHRWVGELMGEGASFEEAFSAADRRAEILHPLSPWSAAAGLASDRKSAEQVAERAGLVLPEAKG